MSLHKYLFFCLIFFGSHLAAESAVKELRVLSSEDGYQAGQTVRLAVVFDLNPGWHIYYKYPGPFGLPTDFQVSTNSKTEKEVWLYPTPEVFTEVTGDQTFGYTNRAIFVYEFIPIACFADRLEVKVKAEWLSCSEDTCLPEDQSFEISLKVAHQNRRQINQDIFAKIDQSWTIPVPQPSTSPHR